MISHVSYSEPDTWGTFPERRPFPDAPGGSKSVVWPPRRTRTETPGVKDTKTTANDDDEFCVGKSRHTGFEKNEGLKVKVLGSSRGTEVRHGRRRDTVRKRSRPLGVGWSSGPVESFHRPHWNVPVGVLEVVRRRRRTVRTSFSTSLFVSRLHW